MVKIIIDFKKLLELDERINHEYPISINCVPTNIDYKSFINIISSDSLCYIPSLNWKHLVNNINANDNTFPLFWACYYKNLKTIKILIENGAVYYPYNLEFVKYEYSNSNSEIEKYDICKLIISKLKKKNTKYFKIKFKIFCGIRLNEDEINFNKYVNEYIDIIKILIEKFPNFINEYDNFVNIIYFLFYSYFDISELLLENINIKVFKKLIGRLSGIFKNFVNVYNNFSIKNDFTIIMKEYYRYNILRFMYLLKRKLNNYSILDEDKACDFDKLIQKNFGTFEDYDSIFYNLYLDECIFDDKTNVCNKFHELDMNFNNCVSVNDYYTGMMFLKIFSEFKNNELDYNKYFLLYYKFCNKFEEFAINELL